MANNVATPLERAFMQINGLELVTSKSTQGHTSLTLQFVLEKNIDAAATDVQTAISQATGNLPTDLPSPPTFAKTNPNDQPILYIALTSDSVTRGRLYDYANTQVGQRISILPGVSRVNVYGTKGAVRIKADPSKMWLATYPWTIWQPLSKPAPVTPGRPIGIVPRERLCFGPKAAGKRPVVRKPHSEYKERRSCVSPRCGSGGKLGPGRTYQHEVLVARLRCSFCYRGGRCLSSGRGQCCGGS